LSFFTIRSNSIIVIININIIIIIIMIVESQLYTTIEAAR
jgi:hypothetical protein